MKLKIVLYIIVVLFLVVSTVSAHPGRTASDGCHFCRTNCEKWGYTQDTRHGHNGETCNPSMGAIDPLYSPTPTSTPTATPTAIQTPNTPNAQGRVGITYVGDCQWSVPMEATGLRSGSSVLVSNIEFDYYDCKTGIRNRRSWGPVNAGVADSAGNFVFAYTHNDYGTYHYVVEDDVGNKAQIDISYGRPNTPTATPTTTPTATPIPTSSYSIKVGIVQFGNMHNDIDPIPAINKWKSWIEDNSKFNITIIYNKYPQLDSIEIPQKGYWDDNTPNYFVYPKDLSEVHKALIPKNTIVNFVLWSNEGKSPSMAGAEFGYNQYEQFQPFLSIPIDLWWDDSPNQQWSYPLTSVMVHEFENGIFGIVNTWLKIPGMATPEGCGGYGYNSSNDPEWIKCRTYVLSTITDEMYQAILVYQAVIPTPPPTATPTPTTPTPTVTSTPAPTPKPTLTSIAALEPTEENRSVNYSTVKPTDTQNQEVDRLNPTDKNISQGEEGKNWLDRLISWLFN